MSEGTNEPIEVRVRVGDLGYAARTEYVTFRGTELERVPTVLEAREDFQRTRYYTLYETPEGLKVYELETVREGRMERQPGQPSAELREVSGKLFTEEELRQERPEIARERWEGVLIEGRNDLPEPRARATLEIRSDLEAAGGRWDALLDAQSADH